MRGAHYQMVEASVKKEKERAAQRKAWRDLQEILNKLQIIQANIKDFAVEDAIDEIEEAVTNYFNEED